MSQEWTVQRDSEIIWRSGSDDTEGHNACFTRILKKEFLAGSVAHAIENEGFSIELAEVEAYELTVNCRKSGALGVATETFRFKGIDHESTWEQWENYNKGTDYAWEWMP